MPLPNHIRDFGSIVWGLKNWRKGDSLLHQKFDAFRNSGLTIEEFLQCPLWYLRNIGLKLIAHHHLEEHYGLFPEKLADLKEAPIIRRNCAATLRDLCLKSEQILAVLFSALHDPYWEVRREALVSLTDLYDCGDAIGFRLLAATFDESTVSLELELPIRPEPTHCKESHFEVRAAIPPALTKLVTGKLALLALSHLTNDPSWIVRFQTAVAVTRIANADPPLLHDCRNLLSQIETCSHGATHFFPLQQTLQKADAHLSKNTFDGLDGPIGFLDPTKSWTTTIKD